MKGRILPKKRFFFLSRLYKHLHIYFQKPQISKILFKHVFFFLQQREKNNNVMCLDIFLLIFLFFYQTINYGNYIRTQRQYFTIYNYIIKISSLNKRNYLYIYMYLPIYIFYFLFYFYKVFFFFY